MAPTRDLLDIIVCIHHPQHTADHITLAIKWRVASMDTEQRVLQCTVTRSLLLLLVHVNGLQSTMDDAIIWKWKRKASSSIFLLLDCAWATTGRHRAQVARAAAATASMASFPHSQSLTECVCSVCEQVCFFFQVVVFLVCDTLLLSALWRQSPVIDRWTYVSSHAQLYFSSIPLTPQTFGHCVLPRFSLDWSMKRHIWADHSS